MTSYFKKGEHMQAWSTAIKTIEKNVFVIDSLFINYYTNTVSYYKNHEAAITARDIFLLKTFYLECYSIVTAMDLIKIENIK